MAADAGRHVDEGASDGIVALIVQPSSFQPVRIELTVAERETKGYGLTFQIGDFAFGPLHGLAQQVARQRLRACDNASISAEHLDQKFTAAGIDVNQQLADGQLEWPGKHRPFVLTCIQRDKSIATEHGQADCANVAVSTGSPLYSL